MKIRGLRWWIIGLIMLITIINYLDRGTLNYMWVTNIEYVINTEGRVSNSENYAIKDGDNYTLIKSNGDKLIVSASRLTFKEKDGRDIVVNREGIAYDLGLISPALSEEEAAKEAKDMLGTITIIFL